MTELYLTRHGETIWNTEKRFQGWGNSELTLKGVNQGKNLNSIVKEEGIEIIYTSPLKRAHETAVSARGNENIEIRVLDDLKELNLGEWEGKTYEELKEEDSENFKSYWSSPETFVPRGGESYNELIERCRKALRIILEESEGKRILVVTHGMTLLCFMHIFTEEDLGSILKRDVFPQTSITKIKISRKCEENEDDGLHYEVILKGDTTHFRNFE